MGLFGIFVPAIDPSIVVVPALDPPEAPTNPSQGIWAVPVASQFIMNLTKFLQQYASSPNASLGGQFGANMLTGFDFVFAGPAGVGFTPALFEVNYTNGGQYYVNSAGNNPNLDLQVASQPVLPTPANASSIIRWTLGYPPGSGYWLIGQNNADTDTHLECTVSAAIMLFGVNIFFGSV